MPLDPDFLQILRCPKTRKPLRMASATELRDLNQKIADKRLADASGRTREQPVTEGLVPEGESVLYPVEDGIPILLIDDALPLQAVAP
ncbi:MAG: Trm112 family protein [Planctomycetota bacterium]